MSLSPSRSCPGCTTNTSGYDFRKGQGSAAPCIAVELNAPAEIHSPVETKAHLASRHGCAETFPDHDMRVLANCNMPELAPILLRLRPACHVSPAPFTHAITLPIGTASCSSGLSPRVHFVERERKPLGPSAASPRDMLAQLANESFGAGHVRFRNIVGAVVDMPMRSDLPAANAFLRDHLRVSLAGKKFRLCVPKTSFLLLRDRIA